MRWTDKNNWKNIVRKSETDTQTAKKIESKAYRNVDRQEGKQTCRQTDRRTDTKAGQTNRQKDNQNYGKKGRQTQI